MGNFACRTKDLESKLNEYGLDVVVYFRSLKILIITLLLISLVNIFLFMTYVNYNKIKAYEFRENLNKMSIGNLNSSKK